jgi:CRISPR-associated protein Csd1
LETWHKEFAWYQRHTQEIIDDKSKKKFSKTTYPISSPVPKDIAKAAYGENVSDDLKKKVIERLLPCIVDGLAFPHDLVQSCVRKATNRATYDSKEQWLWEKNLCITCALYKGFRTRHPDLTQRRNFDMALEESYHSRDYLYGRLLAVAERIEEDALNITGEKRPTNAARLMQRFADQPAKTWLTLYKALDSYMQRLQVSPTGFLYNRKKELGEILEMFALDDYNNNAPLSGEFLLGYYCQRQKRYTKSTTTDVTPDETTSAGETE